MFGTVVPLQLGVHQHAVRGLGLAVLAGQQVQLGAGSKVQMTDVVALRDAKEIIPGSICMLEISLAGVVVFQSLLIIGAFVDLDIGFLCQILLVVQSLDELLGGHVSLGDRGLEVGDDLILGFLIRLDLDVTDPNLFALFLVTVIILREDVIPEVLICLVQSSLILGVHSGLHGLVHRLVDGQGVLLQVAVVDGNGGLAIGIGGDLFAVLVIQDDLVCFNCVNTELLGEHALDGFFVRFPFRQGDGVGGGLVAVLFDEGVLVVCNLGVNLAVSGSQGGLVLVEGPVVAALSNKHLVEGIGSHVRALGLFGDGPLCLGDIALKADVLVALGDQVCLGLAGVLLEQGVPCKGFLLGVGQGFVFDVVGGSDLVTVLVRGDLVKADKATLLIVPALSAFRRSGNDRAGVAGDLVVLTGLRIGPADLAVGDQSRTGEGVVLHIGDLIRILARDGGVNGVGDGGFDLCTVILKAVGLAAYSGSKDAAFIPVKGACIDCLLQFCQSGFIGGHAAGSLVQSFPQSLVLDLVLGGFLVGSLGGALLGLGDADINGQVPAECGVLVHSQLYPLTVVGTVVDIAALNGVAVVVQLGNDLSVGQLIGAGGVDLDGVLPDGAILGSLGVGVRAVLYAAGVLAALFLQHLVQLGVGQGLAVAKLDFRKHHIGGDVCLSFLLCLLPGDGQLGGGFGGDLVVLNGDVGGADLGVALCVQNGLGPGEGIGAVGVHRGLFGIHQLGDVFSGHLSGGFFLFPQLEGLLVAIVLDFLHRVAIADIGILGDIPADVRVHLAQFLLKVDFLLGGLCDNGIQIARGRAGAGGGGGFSAGGHGGLGDGGGAIRVLLHSGRGVVLNRLCAGVGLRLHVGLGLLGLFSGADHHFLGLFLFGVSLAAAGLAASLAGASLTGASLARASLTGASFAGTGLAGASFAGASLARASLTGASLTGASFARASFARASFAGAGLTGASLAAGLAAALGVGHDHAIQLLGAVRVGRGMFFIVFDFRILQGLLSVFRFQIDLRFCGVFLFLGFLRHRLRFRFSRSCFRSICSCCQRACGHTGGQGHGHCRHLQFLVRHGSCSFPESCCLFQGFTGHRS
ncbi:pentapeptide repeat-containing protein [Faecalibacterium duncaniae]|uniref:pentapeptide repeat-containing protein n=1 Tax=Faecalibacterium duncaniae (strain DSM 17677 / JCM 31915 / A2-165) TaxID=411483 RepID=UPI00374D89A2